MIVISKCYIRPTGTTGYLQLQSADKNCDISIKQAILPLTGDLVCLKHWLCDAIKTSMKNATPNRKQKMRMAQLTMVRIAFFNKRRIAEVAELKVPDFLQTMKNVDMDTEVLNALDVSERILSKWFV